MTARPTLEEYQSQLTTAFPSSSAVAALYSAWLESPMGPILAIGTEKELYLLEFLQRRHLSQEIERLRQHFRSAVHPGAPTSIQSIERELKEYFDGKRQRFETPFRMIGTPFQKRVWNALLDIPYGQTRSYLELAKAIGNPKAFRAVANANGKNQLGIIVPCHRVVQSNGDLGGYGGGVENKKRLLQLEGCWDNG